MRLCGRQPPAVVGGLVWPPQCLSPKLSLLPQRYHQVTSYIPSPGAITWLNCSQPWRPWVIQVTCPPPELQSSPGLGGVVLQARAAVTWTSDLGAFSLGGMASASYQPGIGLPGRAA